jgi:nucleotide-binding universal stress UspA family protein
VPNRILVGIDGSLASRAAITWALERARGIHAVVVL